MLYPAQNRFPCDLDIINFERKEPSLNVENYQRQINDGMLKDVISADEDYVICDPDRSSSGRM